MQKNQLCTILEKYGFSFQAIYEHWLMNIEEVLYYWDFLNISKFVVISRGETTISK